MIRGGADVFKLMLEQSCVLDPSVAQCLAQLVVFPSTGRVGDGSRARTETSRHWLTSAESALSKSK